MGRKRTQIELTLAERTAARRFSQSNPDPRIAERAQFALLAATGRHTMEELAVLVGRRRSTLQNWLAKYLAGGLEGLLDRQTSPGLASPLAAPKIQKQLQAGIESGRWTSAAQVAAWLKERHGIARSRKSIYYWLHKH